MKKMVVVLGLVGALLFSAVYVYAHGPGFGPGPRGMEPQEGWRYSGPSSFTPEQRAKFIELRQKHIEETAQLRGALLTKRLELQSLWTNSKSDPKAIVEKEKELRDLQNQMKENAVQFKLEARKILTPEQLSQFGTGWGMGPGFGRGHMMGYGRGMGYGHGMGYGRGMGPGFGACY